MIVVLASRYIGSGLGTAFVNNGHPALARHLVINLWQRHGYNIKQVVNYDAIVKKILTYISDSYINVFICKAVPL
jgi:hypothetical protein